MTKAVFSFKLDTDEDRHVLAWLERQDNKSEAIRQALRDHVSGGTVTLADVYQIVNRLEHKLARGIAARPAPDDDADWDEPPEAAAALDALASL
jgi:hypothetical protein